MTLGRGRLRGIILVAVLGLFGLPLLRVALWRPQAVAGAAPQDGWVRVPGAVHVHTTHSDGSGTPEDVVRAAMLLRANVLLRETSGVRPVVAESLVAFLNVGIHPVVPEQGSVGASGDLAPLSHIALALLGEGDVVVRHPVRGRTEAVRLRAAAALQEAGLAPLHLEAKEGISFINGTQAQTALLALSVFDARRRWRTAHGAAAMTLEALRGTPEPFDERIHRARPHPGQIPSAALLRELLADSEIRESHRENDPRVQDAYSLRCTPQVLGPVHDAIEFAGLRPGTARCR